MQLKLKIWVIPFNAENGLTHLYFFVKIEKFKEKNK